MPCSMIFRASNLLRGVIQFSSRGSEHAVQSFRPERESRISHGLRSMSIAKASKPGAGNIGLSETAHPARPAPTRSGPRLSPSLSLRLNDLWQRYIGAAVIATGSLATYGIWRATLSAGSIFMDMSGAYPEAAALGASASAVIASGWFLHSYHSLNPEKAYVLALKQLRASPALIEVMGTPLVGSELQMAVMVGGGMYVREGLRLRRRCPRVLMAFRLAGPDRQGLVTMDAKKRNGQYVFKLLAVDVQGGTQGSLGLGEGSTSAEGAARLYLRGGPPEYERGGVMEEMRKPYIAALDATSSYEAEDEMDDEVDRLAVPSASSEPAGASGGTTSPWWIPRWRRPMMMTSGGAGAGASSTAAASGSMSGGSAVGGLKALWGRFNPPRPHHQHLRHERAS